MQISWVNDYFDKETIEKGLDYFHQNRVKNLEVDGEFFTAKVWGKSIEPYETEIHAESNGICHTECNCPAGDDCKHCAAVALAAVFNFGGKNIITTTAKVINSPGASKISLWKKILEPIVEDSTLSNAAQTENTEWRVQILVKLTRPGKYSSNENPTIELRPQIFNPETKKAIFKGVEWKYLRYLQNWKLPHSPNEPEKQVAKNQLVWLCKMLDALMSEYYTPRDWLTIPSKNAREVFNLILEAEGLGILFKDTDGGEIVINDSPIKETLLISKENTNINLVAALTDAGKSLEMTGFAIGNPNVFVLMYNQDPAIKTQMQIRPLLKTAGDIRKFFTSIIIPENEAGQFTTEYLPHLVKDYFIISQVESIKPPILGEPTLNISVNNHDYNSIRVDSAIKYGDKQIDQGENHPCVNSDQPTPIARNIRVENKLNLFLSVKMRDAKIQTVPKSSFTLTGIEAKNFIEKVLTVQQKPANINLSVANDLPTFLEITEAPKIEVEMEESNSNDWFDLQIKISVDGITIPLADIFGSLAQNTAMFFLPDGRYIDLSKNPEIQKLQELLKRANKLKNLNSGQL